MARVTSGQTLIWGKEACKTQLLGLSSFGATAFEGLLLWWWGIFLCGPWYYFLGTVAFPLFSFASGSVFGPCFCFFFSFACLPWPHLKELLEGCPLWELYRFYTLLPLVPTRAPGGYCTIEIGKGLFLGNNVSSKFGLLLIYLLLVYSRCLWAPQGLLGIIIMLF